MAQTIAELKSERKLRDPATQTATSAAYLSLLLLTQTLTHARRKDTEELRAACAPVPANPPAGKHRRSAFRSANPTTKVPAVMDGGPVLTESVAIVFYLAEKYPEARLLPADAGAARGAPAVCGFTCRCG